jgi:hypothetical protein
LFIRCTLKLKTKKFSLLSNTSYNLYTSRQTVSDEARGRDIARRGQFAAGNQTDAKFDRIPGVRQSLLLAQLFRLQASAV